MACCAFAVMLLMQVLAPARADAAVAWAPGATARPVAPVRPWRRSVLGVLAVDLAQEAEIVADARGTATVHVMLDRRVAIEVRPAA
ncbi:hypothetical protein [Sphingomonas adhaesiva]|uniref:hypothetical protein n=1 Tax=Sphingomonas adhaesiva TaxID=28212 RepID=UPI002FF68F6E